MKRNKLFGQPNTYGKLTRLHLNAYSTNTHLSQKILYNVIKIYI